MPRLKPPFPAAKGYWKLPTNINNVETYANVAWIISNGGEAFAARGSEKSNGSKVFALAGKIKKGGLVEVPMGMTLRQVIYDIGGGIKNDKNSKRSRWAVLPEDVFRQSLSTHRLLMRISTRQAPS